MTTDAAIKHLAGLPVGELSKALLTLSVMRWGVVSAPPPERSERERAIDAACAERIRAGVG